MEIMKNELLYSSFITLLIFEIYACKHSGGGEEDKSTEYKAYNKDDNDYLNDEEFDQPSPIRLILRNGNGIVTSS